MSPDYAAIGIFRVGQNRPTLMSANGRIILFDTPAVAKSFLPVLGCGRREHWDAAGETICFTPIDPEGVNRACILTGYDPYHLPAGLPVRSETKGRAWRGHVHYTAWWRDLGQMVKREDGTFANTALAEK